MALDVRVTELAPYELLLSVAEHGSVGAAARAHGVSQPSASARLRHLERRLGLPLLSRSTQGSRLTEQGALVAEWAREALDAAGLLEAGIASLHRGAESHLVVSASLTVAEYLLPHWLVVLHERVPDTTVSLTTDNSDDVAAAVLDDRAVLGFIEGPTLAPGLSAQIVGRDELVVVTDPAHPWARRGSIEAEELARTPLVSREHGSGTRHSLERALRSRTDRPLATPLLELSSTTAIKTAVSEGVAPGVLSSLAVAPDLATGRMVAVTVVGLDLTRVLRAVRRTHTQLVGPAQELVLIAGQVGRGRGR